MVWRGLFFGGELAFAANSGMVLMAVGVYGIGAVVVRCFRYLASRAFLREPLFRWMIPSFTALSILLVASDIRCWICSLSSSLGLAA